METEMEDVEDTITCRGTCDKKVWPKHGRSSFLIHVNKAKKCKAFYTEEEINEFRKISYSQQKKKKVEIYGKNDQSKKLKRRYSCMSDGQSMFCSICGNNHLMPLGVIITTLPEKI